MNEIVGALGTPEASELLLCADSHLVCETYVFEPSTAEAHLGRLYAVGETEDRNGIGNEILDMTIQALQREYYREPNRTSAASFESALHQANIVLHDAAEQGVRDWMGHWHVVVAVVADSSLHISTAGDATMFLVRKGKATLLTEDLSYSPITDPLRTFSQVASGALAPRDVLFLGTAGFAETFRREDLLRFSVEHGAATIRTRLEQLYADQQSVTPLSAMVISILPRHIATAPVNIHVETTAPARRRSSQGAALLPRQPLVIHRTALRATVALVGRLTVAIWRWLKVRVWPLLLHGSRRGGQAVATVSAVATRNVQSVTQQGLQRWKTRSQTGAAAAVSAPVSWTQWVVRLPRTSKIFAVLALMLALVLLASIFLLQSKRADDATIQQASETLHEGQTKLAAAETALIYDNRDQARNFLQEAQADGETLIQSNVYTQEAQQLLASVAVMQDRLQKVLRASTVQPRVVGDFGPLFDQEVPAGLVTVDGRVFSFNATTNEIFAMSDTGETTTVSEQSEGMGALKLAIPHKADKNIVFITDTPGAAILDAKAGTLSAQEMAQSGTAKDIEAAAVFGSRLYIKEVEGDSIYSYNKTLQGYAGRARWITSTDFPATTITSLAVDGSIYTLHTDGSLRELFKGEAVPFEVEKVDPPLAGARRLLTAEGFVNLYVFDPERSRVVVLTKQGALVQQIVLDVAETLTDIAIAEDESILYVLDGTRVLALPLGGEQ